jgi:hypothetical protein
MEEFQAQSQKLATAARSTFEKATLLDPLIAKFAPTWTSVVVYELAVQDAEKWAFATDKRLEPAVLTSSSHKTTVKEIAYLSLLNYADLLVASQKQADAESRGEGILDFGVVKSLALVGWDDTTDQQLALVALCDAVGASSLKTTGASCSGNGKDGSSSHSCAKQIYYPRSARPRKST